MGAASRDGAPAPSASKVQLKAVTGSATPATWAFQLDGPRGTAVRWRLTSDAPWLSADPLSGTTPFQAAWLCRRFARGYDDLGAYRGAIALFPRAPAADLGLVRARLEGLLRGRVALRPADEPLHQARFEATG